MIRRQKQKKYYPAWTEISLVNIEHNYKQLKQRAGGRIKMLVAVKADAYGHGMVEVAKRLGKCKVDYLGVASVNEAMLLRNSKIKTPILVMGSVYDNFQIKQALKNDISLTIADLKAAMVFNKIAAAKKKITVHIKVDTGMGRIGIWHQDAFSDICRINRLENLNIQGIFTHFPSADIDPGFTAGQLKIFKTLLRQLKDNKIEIPLVHAANSIAISRSNKNDHDFLNMARPGIMVYGLYPVKPNKIDKKISLKPALELKSSIVFIKKVSPGRTISYGRTYKVKKTTRIATISIGYADGYRRCLSGKSYVKIKRRLYPVVGRICMDQTMVDIGLDPGIKVGDEVVFIGKSRNNIISAEKIAKLCNTIPYEITCGISARVGRIFKND